jgi:hypothetical protein
VGFDSWGGVKSSKNEIRIVLVGVILGEGVGGIPLSPEEKVSVLVKLSGHLGLSAEDILAVYLVVGDGIFFLMDMLQGRTVTFPSLRVLRSAVAGVGGYHVKRLNKSHYEVNGVEDFPSVIKRGDVFVVSGDSYEALGSPQSILGGTYILCKFKE